MTNINDFPGSKSIIDKFCGWCIGLPLFAELSGSGIKLPDSHFEMNGIPLHTSMLALIILAMSHKFNKTQIIFTLLFIIYIISCFFQDSSRSLLAIQSIYFFTFYFILKSLSPERLETISLSSVKALMFFVIAHFLSLLFFSTGSVLSLFSNTADFWGIYTIYQSHLTYPLVMIMAIWMTEYQKVSLGGYKRTIFIIFASLIIIFLLRRASIAILLVFFICYRPKISLLFSPIILGFIVFYSGALINFSRFTNFQRGGAWQDSLDVITDINSFFLGNGINNYSHNYFMHTLTTHGIIFSSIIFLILAFVVATFFKKLRYALPPLTLLLAFIFIDWNVNANLYQPYYASMLALTMLILSTKTKRDMRY
ncbi:MAG: hypothetical protein CMG00_09470 [Candidatus Marinimicrobia bacterium]|nr:hypothetical protein [Candidatus Neomarinimicrobiota bacterium]